MESLQGRPDAIRLGHHMQRRSPWQLRVVDNTLRLQLLELRLCDWAWLTQEALLSGYHTPFHESPWATLLLQRQWCWQHTASSLATYCLSLSVVPPVFCWQCIASMLVTCCSHYLVFAGKVLLLNSHVLLRSCTQEMKIWNPSQLVYCIIIIIGRHC